MRSTAVPTRENSALSSLTGTLKSSQTPARQGELCPRVGVGTSPFLDERIELTFASDGKSICLQCGRPGFDPWLGKIPWRRKWQPTPVLLPGKSQGQRNLPGCSPWGLKESDTTERLHFHFPLSCTGERNGNPLQCSCLENPMDGGAWRATVHGVAKSQT